MRIGIDVDGVLVNMEQFVMDYGTKFCHDNFLPQAFNPVEYQTGEAFKWKPEMQEKFWNMYLEYYATKYPPRDFAAEVIQKLKEKHEIYIVTGRNEEGLPKESYGKMHQFLENWLKENNIHYDKLVYTRGSKLPFCEENKIDIMIEDWAKEIKEISTKIPVICFNANYNLSTYGENTTRVYSWYEILDKINIVDKYYHFEDKK